MLNCVFHLRLSERKRLLCVLIGVRPGGHLLLCVCDARLAEHNLPGYLQFRFFLFEQCVHRYFDEN